LKSLFVGLEIGGSKLQAGLGTADGELLQLKSDKVPAEPNSENILAWFEPVMDELKSWAATNDGVIKGLGIGFGGPVNSKTGRTIKSHQVDGWGDFPIQQWFESRYSIPVVLENDANAAGWGEFKCGIGKGSHTFCYMNIGSGIGGALVVDGKLHNGQGFGAFEVGHTRVSDPHHPHVYTKLENICSGWSIERRLQQMVAEAKKGPLWDKCKGKTTEIRCDWLPDAIASGDIITEECLDTVTTVLGLAVSNFITLVHPEVVAIGGGVSLLGGTLMEPLRSKIDEMVFEPYKNRYKIEVASLSDTVVVVGALLLAGTNICDI
jgi:glucokinase